MHWGVWFWQKTHQRERQCDNKQYAYRLNLARSQHQSSKLRNQHQGLFNGTKPLQEKFHQVTCRAPLAWFKWVLRFWRTCWCLLLARAFRFWNQLYTLVSVIWPCRRNSSVISLMCCLFGVPLPCSNSLSRVWSWIWLGVHRNRVVGLWLGVPIWSYGNCPPIMIPATQKDNKSELYAHFTAPNCLSFLLVVKKDELPTLSLLLDLATPKNYKASF